MSFLRYWEILEGPYGWVPVEAAGIVNDMRWYFRARGAWWHLEVEGGITSLADDYPTKPLEVRTSAGSITFDVVDRDRIVEMVPFWWYGEEWGTWPDAGYMSAEQATDCIKIAMDRFLRNDPPVIHRGEDGWQDYVLKTWSEAIISTSCVLKYLDFKDRDELIAYAVEKRLEIPYFEKNH